MPELPEVETVRRALQPHLTGRRILHVECHAETLRRPLDLVGRPELMGARVLELRRRAKYMLAELDSGFALLLHLGMTGRCHVDGPDVAPRPHDRVSWSLDDGRIWRLEDARKFGLAELHRLPEPGADPAILSDLGPEPLSPDFGAGYLREVCRGRRLAIKALLMDGKAVAGIGNIYASEACFRARIRPATPAGRISLARLQRLAGAVREVLVEAIDAGGTTISDFAAPDGSEGSFRTRLDVYGRDGEPCDRCREGGIRRLVIAGRSTFDCPRCQR